MEFRELRRIYDIMSGGINRCIDTEEIGVVRLMEKCGEEIDWMEGL